MLPKKFRLKKKKEIEAVFSQGDVKNLKFVFVKFLKNNLDHPRFCFSVSKKIALRANKRNYIRRVLREIIRKEILPFLKKNFDYLIIAKPQILNKNYHQIKEDLKNLL